MARTYGTTTSPSYYHLFVLSVYCELAYLYNVLLNRINFNHFNHVSKITIVIVAK